MAVLPTAFCLLPHYFVQLLESHQHIPRLRPVHRAEDPGLLELVDDAGRAAVADAHAALQQRGGAELVLDADLRGLAEQRVALARRAGVAPGLLALGGLERCDLVADRRSGGGTGGV